MTTVIYYFTGTGNTLDVALKLSQKLDATLIPIASFTNQKLKTYDKTGVVFPTYMYRPPRIVVDFLNRIPRSPYFFVVATNGGDPGDVLTSTKKILIKNGQNLNAGFTLVMPDNYIPFGGPPDEERIVKIFKTADEQLKDVIKTVQTGESEQWQKSSWFKTKVFPALWYKIGYWAIPKYDNNFWVVNDKCAGCGSCARVCPVNNISMKDNRPQWHNNCQQCMACLQWCNLEAIELGKKSAGVKRYRHPKIKRRQIIGQKKR